MALIYGQPGAEIDLLRNCPPGINCFNDIKPSLVNNKNELENRRKTFYDNLPGVIQQEREKLSRIQIGRQNVETYWNERINTINNSINENKWRIWKYIDLFIKKQFSMPKAIRLADNDINHQNWILSRYENEPEIVFSTEQTGLTNTIQHLEQNINSPEYYGALGEIKVLNELTKLENNFHIFCDIRVGLRQYISYRGRRNLRSAQIDFVVVGPTGVFVIEVKNWSNQQINYHSGLNPYEQVDRAGQIMWIWLQEHFFFYKPPVTKILVPIQHNLRYNEYYKHVMVKDIPRLNNFIHNGRYYIPESKVNKIVSMLR